MFKKIIGYIITFIAGVAAVLSGLAINKRRGLDNGTVDDLRQLGEGQRKLTDIAKSDAAGIKRQRAKIDRASRIAESDGVSIKRAKDILEELRKRKADSNDTISSD